MIEQMEGTDKLWNDLSPLDGERVAQRTGVRFQDDVYLVPFLDRELSVDPFARSIDVPGSQTSDSQLQSNHLVLAILSFLVSGELRSSEGVWISEKELPGGSLFFQGPHAMPTGPIIAAFGSNAKALVERGESLGGVPAQFGDGSVDLPVLPGLRMCIVLWEEDDEFPASCTIMFDKSFKNLLALDVVLGLTSAVVELLVA